MAFFEVSQVFVAEPPFSLKTFDHQPKQAYDVSRDVQRYRQLRETYTDVESRKILLEETTTDLMTHFAELNSVGGFSYRYRINNNTLVEDSLIETPIADMFKDQDGVVASLWLESIIPTLELMPVGATVFTYSARQSGKFEGGYDYAYVFEKADENTIHCNGLELVLSRLEQAAILNRIYQEANQHHLLLTSNPEGDEVRARAFYFPPGKFHSTADAYSQIIGQVVKPIREERSLVTAVDYQNYLQEQLLKQGQQYSRSREIAISIVDDLERIPLTALRQKIAKEQQKDLWRLYPELMASASLNRVNQILLPCGFVDIISSSLSLGDLRFTAGFGLVESSESVMHCVTCPYCKKTVDAIVTTTHIECPSCHAKSQKT